MHADNTFHVVILYDPLWVRRAMVTYSHLVRELEAEFRPELHLWRIDIATTAPFAERAERDIAEAELILIAMPGSKPCPTAFQRWSGHGGAVIALTEEADEIAPTTGTWNSVLRASAKQIHPEIFVWDPAPEEQMAERVDASAVLVGA